MPFAKCKTFGKQIAQFGVDFFFMSLENGKRNHLPFWIEMRIFGPKLHNLFIDEIRLTHTRTVRLHTYLRIISFIMEIKIDVCFHRKNVVEYNYEQNKWFLFLLLYPSSPWTQATYIYFCIKLRSFTISHSFKISGYFLCSHCELRSYSVNKFPLRNSLSSTYLHWMKRKMWKMNLKTSRFI